MKAIADPKIKIIAKRIITNGQWASLYLGYFEASNRFLRDNSRRLDDDACEMLNVLDRGLPRLSALCLCRLWDMPGKDRHSLPALIGIAAFSLQANARDPSFIRDCRRLSNGTLIAELRRFRIVDLAHNLQIESNGGLTINRLREILRTTQPIIDRLVF